MKLSIVMPCYNEKSTLAEIVDKVLALQSEKLDVELVVVDDCSTDGSFELAGELAARHPEIVVARNERNMGKGASLHEGFRRATGDFVGIQDADLEYDPRDYLKMLAAAEELGCDVVFGSRYLRSDSRLVLRFWHSTMNRFLTFCSNFLSDLELTDMETCYKLFRREVVAEIVPKLKERRFGFEPEVTAHVAKGMKKKGWKVAECAISYRPRTFSEGKKIGVKDGLRSLWCMLKYNFAILALAAIAGCSDGTGHTVDPRIADASRPLVAVTQPTEPPFAYRDSSGEIVGSDIDLARRIAAKMGRKLVVEGVEFVDILPRLKEGTADMGIATITITDARRKDVDFSAPYAFGGACFLYRKDGRKPRMSQIASLRIGVETDTVEDLYLCRHGCDPVRFINLVDAIAALGSNKVDAVFSDVPHLKVAAEGSGGLFLVTPQETRDLYGVAVDKRRPDVLAAANAVIAEGAMK